MLFDRKDIVFAAVAVELSSFIFLLGSECYLFLAIKSRRIHVVNEVLVVASYVGMLPFQLISESYWEVYSSTCHLFFRC